MSRSPPEREKEFLESLKPKASFIQVVASPFMVATSIANVDGKPHVFFVNFAGLKGGVVNPIQMPQSGVHVSIFWRQHGGRGFFLPFLGDMQQVNGISEQ